MEDSSSVLIVEEEDCKPSSSSNALWNSYKSLVRRNHVSLEFLEAGLSRILFWTPSTTTSAEDSKTAEQRHRRREVLYGILSLHRLAMDTAMEDDFSSSNLNNDYGMSVRPNDNHHHYHHHHMSQEQIPKTILGLSPTALRISITVIQSLLPSILELSRSPSSSHSGDNNYDYHQRQSRIRLYLERFKFILRLVLMGSYWRELQKQHHEKRHTLQEDVIPPMSIGIMRDGGLYLGARASDNIPTTAQEDGLWRRRNYSGRRTGRTVLRRLPDGSPDTMLSPQYSLTNTNNNNHHHWKNLLVVLGELLYAYRPLYWATVEANTASQPSYRNLLLSIAMDVVSLQCCRCNHSTTANKATLEELKRRKMRLLLYLLRAPIWNKVTEPASDKVEATLERIPVLGRLASTYLRDWLWYMQHPYVAEQG